MKNTRPIAFVLASTDHGTVLINRNDYYKTGPDTGWGIGHQLLNNSSFDPKEIDFILTILDSRRRMYGDGVVALDCGANLGIHTIECSKHMHGWGEVLAFEAQERIFYALVGNITINNCFNARAMWCAVGEESGTLNIPIVDYFKPASFGSLELKPSSGDGRQGENIGQIIDYSQDKMAPVRLIKLDELNFNRLDFIKIDVEGMEIEALKGAEMTLDKHKPVIFLETLKSNKDKLVEFLKSKGYNCHDFDAANMLAIHNLDKTEVKIVK